MKTCSKCGFIGNPNLFKKRTNICKACVSKCNKEYRQQNREVLLQKSKEEYQGNKAQYQKWARQYYLDNRQKLMKFSKNYRELNRDKVALVCKKWRQANLDKRVVYQHRREFNKKNNGRNDLTSEQVLQLRKEFTHCFYCKKDFGEGFRLTLDHVIPFSKGGQNTLSNIVLACGPCNSSKGDKCSRKDIRDAIAK